VKRVAGLALIWSFAVSAAPPVAVNDALILGDAQPDFLSDFRFLTDARTPNIGVFPYALNTPLFSDYAEKIRYVYVPKGAKATYNADGVFDFPIGSAIIKTFAFAADLRAPDKDVRVIAAPEQRLGCASLCLECGGDGCRVAQIRQADGHQLDPSRRQGAHDQLCRAQCEPMQGVP
jgi:hypothetical protein